MNRRSGARGPIGRDADIRQFTIEEIFECEPAQLFVILGDISQWDAAGEPRMLLRKEPKRVQVSFSDATRVNLTFERGDKPGTAKLTLHHDLCKDGAQTRTWKAHWKTQLKAIAKRVQL